MNTFWREVLGTSMPIVSLPGIGATTRTETAFRAAARSASKPAILLTRVPSSSRNSYCVTAGPTDAATTSAVMPNLSSLLTIAWPPRVSTSLVSVASLCCGSWNSSIGGNG